MLTFDLSPQTFLHISGPDAAKFLQGQLTADINEVTSSQSRLAAHCNAKGRIQFTGRLLNLEENSYLLLLPPNMAEPALQSLKKYAIFSKVQLTIVTTWHAIGVVGTPRLEIPTEIDQVTISNQNYLIRVPGVDRFILLSTEKQPIQQSFSAWQCLEIQNGIAWVEPATINEFTPHQLNLPALNAVSFKKGCYTGQEIVARMHYLGKLKEEMACLSWTQHAYGAGMICYDSVEASSARPIGTLICSAMDNQHVWHGLASIKRDYSQVFLDQTKAQSSPINTDDQFA